MVHLELWDTLRAGLDYGEEVHKSRIIGEWSNLIGYTLGSSLVGVYTTASRDSDFIIIISILSTIPTFASNNPVFG